jgi:hypothetical protein
MKRFLKSLTLAVAVVAACVQPAKAQSLVTIAPWTEAASGTSSSNATSIVIDCSKQRNLAVQWTFNLGGAGTSINGLRFIPVLDNNLPAETTVTLSTGFVMAIAANGTTPVTVRTNFDTLGYRYLSLAYSTNGNAQISTNALSYLVKPGAP